MTAPLAPALPQQVLQALQAVAGTGRIGLHEPVFSGHEWEYLKECLDTTYVSSVGPFVERFEADLADYTSARFAVATVNGTAALHVALLVAGVRPEDEVLAPALSFVATVSAIRYCGAVPHFVDSSEKTLGMDPVALREWLGATTEQRMGVCVNRQTGRPIRAMVAMHTFGHPCDLDGLLGIARDFGLVLVEDAAESIGSLYHGRHTGILGLVGILSFNGNKTITTGGGGAILTDDAELARHAKHLSTTAKVPHRWEYAHDQVGFNYRLPNLNAALGCAQLEQLPGFLESKRRLFGLYRDALAHIPQVRVFEEPEGCRSNYWLQTLLLNEESVGHRDSILEITNSAGLMTRPAWGLLHRQTPYAGCPRAPVPVAESLESRIVNLPSSAGLA